MQRGLAGQTQQHLLQEGASCLSHIILSIVAAASLPETDVKHGGFTASLRSAPGLCVSPTVKNIKDAFSGSP